MAEGMPIRTEQMERLMEKISPEGRELWLEMERMAETPPEERAPDHRDKLTELATRSMQLPDEDQLILNELSAEKRRALSARVEERQREVEGLKTLSREMQKEGLRRGMDKEEREKMTVGEFVEEFVGEGEAKHSPEGRELLEEIERRLSGPGITNLSPDEAVGLLRPRIEDLSERDRKLFARWAEGRIRENAATMRDAKEGEAYADAAVDAIHRAQELEILDGKDPTSEAIKGMTLYQAVEILERHGEELPPGLAHPGRPQGTKRGTGGRSRATCAPRASGSLPVSKLGPVVI